MRTPGWLLALVRSFGKFFVLVGVIGAPLTLFRDVSNVLRFPQQHVLTYAAFLKEMPTEGWFKITGCAYDLAGAAYEYDMAEGKVKRVLLPIHEAGKPVNSEAPAPLILETARPDICDVMKRAEEIDRQMVAPAFREELTRDEAKLSYKGDIQGMVRSGLSSAPQFREKLSRLGGAFDGDFTLLMDNVRPGWDKALTNFGEAIIIGILGLFMLGWRPWQKRGPTWN